MLPLSYRLEKAGVVHWPPGLDTGWRSFGNTLMTQVREGSYRIQTATERFDLEAGMGFLIPPGLRHRTVVSGNRAVETVYAHLHCRVYELQGLFTALKRPIIFNHSEGRRIGTCNAAIIACQNRSDDLTSSAEVARQLAELVTIAVASCPDLTTIWSRPERERLLPALRYIQDHLGQTINRNDLARVIDVSVPHLHTLFVNAFGTAPMDVVRRERMQHARQLLHWSSLSVAEVGRQCGFDDPYYFSRAFTRAEGISPSRYRRDCRAGEDPS